MKKALLMVDLQNDFMPNGALPVPEGDAVIPLANDLQAFFNCIVATQDWHPKNHGSFAVNHPGLAPGGYINLAGLTQILWPMHCVQGSYGAELVKGLNTDRIAKVFKKGIDPNIDSYSGFFDNGQRKATGLENFLKEKSIREVYVMGLALDYCIKYTVLDACRLGFSTFLIVDACRGVNRHSEDSMLAIQAMQQAGAQLIYSVDIFEHFKLCSKQSEC
jgi:nicotinamidase/pyrazinamidase